VVHVLLHVLSQGGVTLLDLTQPHSTNLTVDLGLVVGTTKILQPMTAPVVAEEGQGTQGNLNQLCAHDYAAVTLGAHPLSVGSFTCLPIITDTI